MSKLIVLYQKMADLTAPECAGVGAGSCKVPHSCCDSMACSMTKQLAATLGVVLPEYPENNKGAFYLKDNQCTVAPHMRPHCTMHTCSINGLGFKPGDDKWTKKYFKLRQDIEELEFKENRF